MKRTYLDYASTTPTRPRVIWDMIRVMAAYFYNPSSLYKEGVLTKSLIEKARKDVAACIGARAQDVVFTRGGTESIYIALYGTVLAYRKQNPSVLPHIITSSTEHAATLETCKRLEESGLAQVTYLQPQENGEISLEALKNAFTQETVLVTLMYVNNEIGTVMPIKEYTRALRLWKKENKREVTEYPYFHTDASQAIYQDVIDRESLGVDMMTFDAHKFYGPKSVGILYLKEYIPFISPLAGASQEGGKVPGTENVAQIIGCRTALALMVKEKAKEAKRLTALRHFCIGEIEKKYKDALILSKENASPHIVGVIFPGVDTEYLLIELDVHGFMVGTGSACSHLHELSESHVIKALPGYADHSRSLLRLSFGKKTTKKDIRKLIDILPKLLENARCEK